MVRCRTIAAGTNDRFKGLHRTLCALVLVVLTATRASSQTSDPIDLTIAAGDTERVYFRPLNSLSCWLRGYTIDTIYQMPSSFIIMDSAIYYAPPRMGSDTAYVEVRYHWQSSAPDDPDATCYDNNDFVHIYAQATSDSLLRFYPQTLNANLVPDYHRKLWVSQVLQFDIDNNLAVPVSCRNFSLVGNFPPGLMLQVFEDGSAIDHVTRAAHDRHHPVTLVLTLPGVPTETDLTFGGAIAYTTTIGGQDRSDMSSLQIDLLPYGSSGVGAAASGSSTFSLSSNPVRGVTRLHWQQMDAGKAEIQCVDGFGRIVLQSRSDELEAGEQETTLDLSDLPSGVYFARLLTGGIVLSRRFVLLGR